MVCLLLAWQHMTTIIVKERLEDATKLVFVVGVDGSPACLGTTVGCRPGYLACFTRPRQGTRLTACAVLCGKPMLQMPSQPRCISPMVVVT